MIIWFFTCKNWWNKALLVPIGMLFYQIINLLNDEIKFKDGTLDFVVVIPITIILCIILVLIRQKIAKFIPALDLMDRVENEIKKLESEAKND
jgi:hypothetical protein